MSKKTVWFLGFIFLISNAVHAEESLNQAELAQQPAEEFIDEQAEPLNSGAISQMQEEILAPEEGSLDSKSEQVLQSLPTCDDKELNRLVWNKVLFYQKEHPEKSVIEARQQKLLLKNLRNFEQVQTKDFTSSQNYNVANKLIMTKINKSIPEEYIRLCKNNGYSRSGNIYLMIYPYQGEIIVNIINFLPPSSSQEDFFVVYQK